MFLQRQQGSLLAGLRATNEMMLRDFEEKQAANNEKENEENDMKVCIINFKIKYLTFNYRLHFSLMQIVQN